MKLEFLKDLSDGGKYKDVSSDNLIRLYDFNPKEAIQLQNLIKQLLDESIPEINLEKQSIIESVNCQLKLVIHEDNNGINRLTSNKFICKMSKESYKQMIYLIEPFTREQKSGYQWLDESCSESDIDFLFSPGGSW